ncbi:unnamed protein product [Prorocentrum cordatum]|uniref:Uncharacterized protein n=1 Tax=Prorocentrum cordatum TaxID=2364126 RepID=A0ABN9S2E1_9DINO|nr:unnamed protein product [Polarella glacialis]
MSRPACSNGPSVLNYTMTGQLVGHKRTESHARCKEAVSDAALTRYKGLGRLEDEDKELEVHEETALGPAESGNSPAGPLARATVQPDAKTTTLVKKRARLQQPRLLRGFSCKARQDELALALVLRSDLLLIVRRGGTEPSNELLELLHLCKRCVQLGLHPTVVAELLEQRAQLLGSDAETWDGGGTNSTFRWRRNRRSQTDLLALELVQLSLRGRQGLLLLLLLGVQVGDLLLEMVKALALRLTPALQLELTLRQITETGANWTRRRKLRPRPEALGLQVLAQLHKGHLFGILEAGEAVIDLRDTPTATLSLRNIRHILRLIDLHRVILAFGLGQAPYGGGGGARRRCRLGESVGTASGEDSSEMRSEVLYFPCGEGAVQSSSALCEVPLGSQFRIDSCSFGAVFHGPAARAASLERPFCEAGSAAPCEQVSEQACLSELRRLFRVTRRSRAGAAGAGGQIGRRPHQVNSDILAATCHRFPLYETGAAKRAQQQSIEMTMNHMHERMAGAPARRAPTRGFDVNSGTYQSTNEDAKLDPEEIRPARALQHGGGRLEFHRDLSLNVIDIASQLEGRAELPHPDFDCDLRVQTLSGAAQACFGARNGRPEVVATRLTFAASQDYQLASVPVEVALMALDPTHLAKALSAQGGAGHCADELEATSSAPADNLCEDLRAVARQSLARGIALVPLEDQGALFFNIVADLKRSMKHRKNAGAYHALTSDWKHVVERPIILYDEVEGFHRGASLPGFADDLLKKRLCPTGAADEAAETIQSGDKMLESFDLFRGNCGAEGFRDM